MPFWQNGAKKVNPFSVSLHMPSQSDEIHSPEAWARTVLRRTIPAVSSIDVVCTVAISCWLKVLRTSSSHSTTGRTGMTVRCRQVHQTELSTNDFSGLMSSACALASAAAIVPIFSLERCTAAFLLVQIEADRA